MTNNQHGQVPDALRLAEEITNLECSSEAVAKTIAAAADELCRLHVENASLRASPAASPTPPVEQQTQPGAVYAELHEPDATTVGLGAVWNRHSMRDFADRTHALRMEQAAPKAAPGELHDHQILAITTAYEQGVGKGRQAYGSGKEISNPYGTGQRKSKKQ